MNKKLFVFDLDGTLLNRKREINKSSIKTLNKALEKGHKIIFCTARTFTQIIEYTKLFPLMEYAITLNGSVITNLKTLENKILAESIPQDIVKDILSIAKKYKREFQYSDGSSIYKFYFGKTPKEDILDENFFSIGTINPIYNSWEDFSNKIFDDNILHLTLKMETEYITEIYNYLNEKYKNKNISIVKSSTVYIDINSHNISKYNSILEIQKKYSIKNSDTYCFGDSNNDISMIKNSGFGIAMGNATSDVKEIASRVIGDNDSNDISIFIEEVLKE